jgi:hypothetical protein
MEGRRQATIIAQRTGYQRAAGHYSNVAPAIHLYPAVNRPLSGIVDQRAAP